MSDRSDVFQRIGLPQKPLVLAPLAGVSDQPFRRVCYGQGADLCYIEMLSATALCFDSPRTLSMIDRHDSEAVLGVQITSKTPEEMHEAVRRLDGMDLDTIDINMGCPVQKVVKSGCGSAILKDPSRLAATVAAARRATSKVLSVKIRLGWDHSQINVLQTVRIAEDNGAEWITIHGRTRSDNYSQPVHLDWLSRARQVVSVPVIGNGNIFGPAQAEAMSDQCGLDGLMVSRGALGNPWIFGAIKRHQTQLSLDSWLETVNFHLDAQAEAYGPEDLGAAVRMRKHLLWYCSGWPGARFLREKVNQLSSLEQCREAIYGFADLCRQEGHLVKNLPYLEAEEFSQAYTWDPKFQMDRQLDRGVGADLL